MASNLAEVNKAYIERTGGDSMMNMQGSPIGTAKQYLYKP